MLNPKPALTRSMAKRFGVVHLADSVRRGGTEHAEARVLLRYVDRMDILDFHTGAAMLTTAVRDTVHGGGKLVEVGGRHVAFDQEQVRRSGWRHSTNGKHAPSSPHL